MYVPVFEGTWIYDDVGEIEGGIARFCIGDGIILRGLTLEQPSPQNTQRNKPTSEVRMRRILYTVCAIKPIVAHFYDTMKKIDRIVDPPRFTILPGKQGL